MDELTAWLESQRATATDDFALGAPHVSRRCCGRPNASTCRSRSSSWSAARISSAISRRSRTPARRLRPRRASRPASTGCAPTSRRAARVEGARAQLAELRQFVIDKKLVSHPEPGAGAGGRIAAVQPRQLRLHQHSGSVRKPGGEGDATTSRRPMRSGAPPNAMPIFPARPTCCSCRRTKCGRALPPVAVHERQSVARRRRLWWDYAFGEGWAHYAEEMMYDAGLGGGQPEMRVGMLTNALLRDVRFLSAICLHSGCMSLEESEKMFPRKRLRRRRQRAPAGVARHLRPGSPRLHARQAHDPQAARRLARGESVGDSAAVPRQVPVVRCAADSAGAQGDARKPPARCFE